MGKSAVIWVPLSDDLEADKVTLDEFFFHGLDTLGYKLSDQHFELPPTIVGNDTGPVAETNAIIIALKSAGITSKGMAGRYKTLEVAMEVGHYNRDIQHMTYVIWDIIALCKYLVTINNLPRNWNAEKIRKFNSSRAHGSDLRPAQIKLCKIDPKLSDFPLWKKVALGDMRLAGLEEIATCKESAVRHPKLNSMLHSMLLRAFKIGESTGDSNYSWLLLQGTKDGDGHAAWQSIVSYFEDPKVTELLIKHTRNDLIRLVCKDTLKFEAHTNLFMMHVSLIEELHKVMKRSDEDYTSEDTPNVWTMMFEDSLKGKFSNVLPHIAKDLKALRPNIVETVRTVRNQLLASDDEFRNLHVKGLLQNSNLIKIDGSTNTSETHLVKALKLELAKGKGKESAAANPGNFEAYLSFVKGSTDDALKSKVIESVKQWKNKPGKRPRPDQDKHVGFAKQGEKDKIDPRHKKRRRNRSRRNKATDAGAEAAGDGLDQQLEALFNGLS